MCNKLLLCKSLALIDMAKSRDYHIEMLCQAFAADAFSFCLFVNFSA